MMLSIFSSSAMKGRPDEDCLVCVLGEQGIFVCLGVDSHSGDAQLPAGSHDPYGYFSSVGDQDLAEHPQMKGPARVKPF
jgi:hypothetical protein